MHSSFQGLTFCIHTFGCQMNKHDSERISGMLEGLGALQVETIEEADIVVFMTCCVREAADIRLYGQVASMKNIKVRVGSPLAKRIVAVGGCIGQRDGEKLVEELPHLDVVFGTHNLASLPSYWSRPSRTGGIMFKSSNRQARFRRSSYRPRALVGGLAPHYDRMQQFLLVLHSPLCSWAREVPPT